MTWYAAHLIMYFKFKDNKYQINFPVFENIVLIEAESDTAAAEKANQSLLEKDSLSEDDCWNNIPGRWCSGGVRKIIECLDGHLQPSNGTEISYSQYVCENKKLLDELIQGDIVSIIYEE